MYTWIALFRGINVGGRQILPMKELKVLLEKIGCSSVTTYIQSGNVVFRHDEANAAKLQALIARAVHTTFGFDARVLLLTPAQLSSAQSKNPFSEGESEPKTLHLYFLAEDAVISNLESFEVVRSETEQFQLIGRVFYLHAPDGIGRSKLAARVEKLLGVPATARNWRTVQKVLQLAADKQ